MNMKKGIFMMVAAAGFLLGSSGRAVVYPDQVVQDGHDEENADAISRFGGGDGRSKRELSGLLRPISESSFTSSGGRAPASVTDRAPAGKAARSAPKSAALRQLRKNRAVQEVAVIANEYGFFPSTVFVTEGVAVRLFITGASAKSQCFMLDEFGIRRQVRSQKVEEIQFTPEHPGRYAFNCPMNGAKGQIVVRQMEVGERSPASVVREDGGSTE